MDSNKSMSADPPLYNQPQVIQDIVLHYLVQHGYTATAKQFVQNVGKEPSHLQKLFDLAEERKSLLLILIS